jgi:hypothetical protein
MVLVSGPQVTPVNLGTEAIRAAGVISRDRGYRFSYWSHRVDLRTGKSYSEGYIHVGLRKGSPPIPFARTENQAHYDKGAGFGAPDVIHVHNQGIDLQTCDALDNDRLLTYTDFRMYDGKTDYLIVTEFHLDSRRDGTQNVCWLLAQPSMSTRTVGARYVDEKSFEVWVLQPGAKNWALVRYLGIRADPKAGLRREGRVELTGFPATDTDVRGRFVPNSFDPKTGRFILSGPDRTYDLVDVYGKVKGSYKPELDPSMASPEGETLAVWHLTVPEGSVPEGKAAWEPIARSADGRHWLVRESGGKDYRLLTLKKQ